MGDLTALRTSTKPKDRTMALLPDPAANLLKTAYAYASLHSAAPDGSGSNETTAARLPVTWTGPTSGVITVTNLEFTGVASNGAVTHVGLWSALTNGTFFGAEDLTGDQQANAAGEYRVNSLAITVNAS